MDICLSYDFYGGDAQVTLKKKTIRGIAVFYASALFFANSAYVGVVAENEYDVRVTIDVDAENTVISPYIYGISDTADVTGADYTAVIQTGDLFSTYNWENNFSNSGSADYNTNKNEIYRIYGADTNNPAAAVRSLQGKSFLYEIDYTVTTLPIMGYVAADANGPILDGQNAPSDRWISVEYRRGTEFPEAPNTDDGRVCLDEYVAYIVREHGKSGDGGVNGYILDNDASLWAEKNPYAAGKVKFDEYIEKNSEAAKVVKDTDKNAVVFGGSFEGMESLVDFRNDSAWRKVDEDYSWFVDYYLSQMEKESREYGSRLLDVLDVHCYPDAMTDDGDYVYRTVGKDADEIRIQMPRLLWDGSYYEGGERVQQYKQFYPLIPTLQASINQYYHGTKLSFSEYDFGGGGNISGGIAQADLLGIFAKHDVYMAALNPQGYDTRYQTAAIRLFTNYDGNGNGFGDVSVRAGTSDSERNSVYAAVSEDDSLRVVLINKDYNNSQKVTARVKSEEFYTGGKVYGFDAASSEIRPMGEAEFESENDFTYTIPPASVVIVEFTASDESLHFETTLPEETLPAETQAEETSAETTVPDETQTPEKTEITENPAESERVAGVPVAFKAVTVLLGIATAAAIAYLIIEFRKVH
ncbi:MAG: endoglucanase [Ruminococcus sp.]|nr:endoglucanase [Ruminococcus sp.]